jgi:glutamine---fructose-6-phosphate transaminase (isomerizing)
MCGIIAVIGRRAGRTSPTIAEIAAELRAASDHLAPVLDRDCIAAALIDAVAEAAAHVERADLALRGTPGVRTLLGQPAGAAELQARTADLQGTVDQLEAQLDADGRGITPAELETLNTELVRVKDALWAISRDRLRAAAAVGDLAGGAGASSAAIDAFWAVQVALSSIDRLEVRGRDSAGIHLLVRDHALDLTDPTVTRLIAERTDDPLFRTGSLRLPAPDAAAFVYKAAAEIGELGDNTRVIRDAIRADVLLHLALANETASVTVLGHTRWASVGIISEANAHPLNAEELPAAGDAGEPVMAYVTAALNGDVDNHADLVAIEGLRIAREITTDAKVIPALVARRLDEGAAVDEAFRATVAALEGSVAIAANVSGPSDQILLALRGSGQSLYVGLTDDAFIVASEPYGLVEETPRYLRVDGETPADAENPESSRGQIVLLDGNQAGQLAGIDRRSYDGTALPVTTDDLQQAQITTRDIDRGDAPHYLLKEISEAPASFRKTLRGKLVERDGRMVVELGPETLPLELRERLRAGAIRRVLVIGQGTAAVAGQSLAAVLVGLPGVSDHVIVEAIPATELSGFRLVTDMHDTLVVAISQSGTTTDTNRTVDLVRDRGATVVAIVNRRNSDLVDRADGVLYTSDGRDVEMSVASTKAFYAQIAAGFLLAFALADDLTGDGLTGAPPERDELLSGLRDLPDAMVAVLDRRAEIAAAAQRQAPPRRSWAVVGNGVNRVAAHEIRIKLSELCYKAIACDVTEDKKHIDLSSEPLILVCAAGLTGSNADDVAKELAIYRAHKAAAVVIASEGQHRFNGIALETIEVPIVHPALAFVLSAMVGHLFGYEAALAIDASARPLREARAAIEAVVTSGGRDADASFRRLRSQLEPLTSQFFDGLRSGGYDGSLEAGTAVRVASMLRYATGIVPLDAYQVEYGKVGTPSVVVEDLTAALTEGIEQLTRPVDAIKHQAKTVTVGISRADETLLQVGLVQELLAAGVARDNLSYRALRSVVALDRAVAQVTGFTRYRIEGDVERDAATISVVDRGGLGAQIRSRTDDDPRLRGTKQLVAIEREVTVARGRSDDRTLVFVPEVKGNQTVGLTLLHVQFVDRLEPAAARAVLQGYRNRYASLKGAVTETEVTFDDTRLAEIDVADLLTTPVYVLADRWRQV